MSAEVLREAASLTDGQPSLVAHIPDGEDKAPCPECPIPPVEQPAENEVLAMFHAGKTRRCVKCDGTDWRNNANGRLTCRDCEKAHKRERKNRRHRERGDRCGCGADVTSLNPAEVVVHNWGGGACRIVPAKRVIPPAVADTVGGAS